MNPFSLLDYYAAESLDVLAANAFYYARHFQDERAERLGNTILNRRRDYENRRVLYMDLQFHYPEYNQSWFWLKIKLMRILDEYLTE